MIKTYALHTGQIDDEAAALDDLCGQMDGLPLMEHTVGIVACHSDFVTAGVVAAITRAMPFPVVGLTTFYQASPVAEGLFELSLTVLTSDDIRFGVAGCLAPGDAPHAETVASVYRQAYDVHGAQPALIISFLPAARPVTGDAFLRMLDACSGGVPSFGADAAGDDEQGSGVYVICEDGHTDAGFALLLLVGDVGARCYHGSFDLESLLGMTATVTHADGATVRELNGQPAADYLAKNGVALSPDPHSMVTVPFLFKIPGGEALVARTLGGIGPQGELVFFAEIPQGSLLRVGTVTSQDILDISQALVLRAARENPGAAALLMFSCVGRYITLGLDTTSELKHVEAAIPAGMPYLACYTNGEICPVPRKSGTVNRYHNGSFVICALT